MKRIALVCYRMKVAENYKIQLIALFDRQIQVDCFCDDSYPDHSAYDLVLVSSYENFQKLNGHLPLHVPLVKFQRTITRQSFEMLNHLSTDACYALVDETKTMAYEMFSVFRQLDLKLLSHCVPFEETQLDENRIMLSIGGAKAGKFPKNVDVGLPLIDLMGILDIGTKLGLDHLLQEKDIRSVSAGLQSVNVGLLELMNNANRFGGLMRILSQTKVEGVIGFDLNGRIVTMNHIAKGLLKHPVKSEPETIQDVFQDLDPYKPIIPFDDMIIKGYEQDLIGSLNEIYSSGRLTGYVLYFNGFSNLEERQHTLREKLLEKGHDAKYHFSDFYGDDHQTQTLLVTAKGMARTEGTVLIMGETGTGKELLAQAIHNYSSRKNYSFVAVNCGAFPESLLESELFGYEEGAFTGAKKGGKLGLFELAHNGTLFLDEISEMPLLLQQRLLRVLQEREIMRLGSDKIIKINVRIIAATNRDLRLQIKQQKFREDLFYRLNVLPLQIPPLRARKSVIQWIINHYIKENPEMKKLNPDLMQFLIQLPWKGNVRELMNVLDYHKMLKLYEMSYETLKPLIDFSEEEICSEHQDLSKCMLEVIATAHNNRQRLGRSKIHEAMLKRGYLVSEAEIRLQLSKLADEGFVRIGTGRQGTLITEKGIKELKLD